MKKILSSFLISFIIFTNILVPISVGINGKKLEINTSRVSAEYNYGLKVTPTLGDTYITLGIELIKGTAGGDYATILTTSSTAKLELRATVLLNNKKITDNTARNLSSDDRKTTLDLGKGFLDKLEPGKPYKTKIELVEVLDNFSASGTPGYAGKTSKTLYEKIIDTPTTKEGEQTVTKDEINISGRSNTIKEEPVSVTPKIGETENNNVYKMLVPLPGITCMDNTGENKECIGNNIGKYLNLIFKIGIGLCAALAVIMLIIYGVVYMGDESIFAKTEAKKKMLGAVAGLIIALGGWALLNTINPDLTGKNGLLIDQVVVKIDNFDVSGSATFDGKPIKINFNKEAYPAAKIASQKTGVETAFILAMFAQETGNGANTGTCNYTSANMGNGQLEALKKVASNLGLDYTKINMSCSGGGSTHGGAIGYTQFLPGTWLEYSSQAKQMLGHEPNPWNTADALMMTALFLKSKGGAGTNTANQEAAACKYFGSCNVTVSCGNGISGTYGQCILGKKVSIQQQIDESIKKGEIQ